MGLGDLKGKLLLFFAKKLRDWANSIDENVQSPPLQPASVAVDRRGSEAVTEPGPDDDGPDSEQSHAFARVSNGPPQHWVDLVRERAPELLSLTPEYPPEVALPEDRSQARRSDGDHEVTSHQGPVNVPRGEEDVDRKSGPVVVSPSKVGNKRSSRKLTRMSFLPGTKPLPLKPLSEPNPHLQPRRKDGDQVIEPVKSAQLNEVRDQVTESVKPAQLIEVFGSEKVPPASADRSSPGARNKDHVATRESAQPSSRQTSRWDKTSADHDITKSTTQISPAAHAPDELNVTNKSEVERPAFNVVRKPPSGPRRYLQALVSVTRKTLRPTSRREVRSAQATTVKSAQATVVNFLNPFSQRSSSTPDVGPLAATPTPVTKKSEMKAEPLTVVSARPTNFERRHSKPEEVAYQSLRAPEPARQQASSRTGLRPKVPIRNVKTTSGFPSTIEFPRPASPVGNASNAHVQDAFVNMPALMDEEKMNRASSIHLAKLRPGKNDWPDLPPATSMEVADELAAYDRDIERMRRLKQEQRGTPWNE